MKSFDINNFDYWLADLENLFKNHKINESPDYKEWYSEFKEIYGSENANFKLYSTYAALIIISMIFLQRYVLKDNEKVQKVFEDAENLKEVFEQIDNQVKEVKLIEFNYFKEEIGSQTTIPKRLTPI